MDVTEPLALAAALASVLKDWDIVQDGQPFPPTEENIATLPFPIVMAVAQRLGDAPSGGGRAQADLLPYSCRDSTTPTSTGTRRNGSATSPLRASIG